jgi:16S rRNA (cytosine967-C5)-methyltransferase
VVKKQRRNPREIALTLLYDIEEKGACTSGAISNLTQETDLSFLDRRFIVELVFGTTKMRRRLDHILGEFLQRKSEELTPWIRNILRMGIYQIDFLDKIPPRAAVDESVKLAKRFGHKGTVALVNAVLRSYLREKSRVTFPSREEDVVENIALFYSFPNWMVEEWLGILGEEETIRLCEEFNRRPHLTCRINFLKIDPALLERELEREKVKFKTGRFLESYYHIESKTNLDRFAPLQKGLVYIQDESAGLAVHLLDPQPGERVLDLCAAPGGKSILMAELMQDKGVVIAVDLSPTKLQVLNQNCLRLGAHSVVPCCADVRNFSCEPADRVLVDAPCSALGTLGANADARWRKQKTDPSRLSRLQLEIMENAAKLVKEGGVLVYSTCTITLEENEQVIDRFLRQNEEFELTDAGDFVTVEVVNSRGMIRTFPHLHKINGGFACRLEKTKVS